MVFVSVARHRISRPNVVAAGILLVLILVICPLPSRASEPKENLVAETGAAPATVPARRRVSRSRVRRSSSVRSRRFSSPPPAATGPRAGRSSSRSSRGPSAAARGRVAGAVERVAGPAGRPSGPGGACRAVNRLPPCGRNEGRSPAGWSAPASRGAPGPRRTPGGPLTPRPGCRFRRPAAGRTAAPRRAGPRPPTPAGRGQAPRRPPGPGRRFSRRRIRIRRRGRLGDGRPPAADGRRRRPAAGPACAPLRVRGASQGASRGRRRRCDSGAARRAGRGNAGPFSGWGTGVL